MSASVESSPSQFELTARAVIPWFVVGAGIYLISQPGLLTKAVGAVTALTGAQLATNH